MRNLEQRLIYAVRANGFGLTIFRQIADIPLDDVASANKTEWTCQVVTKVIVLYVDVASRGSQLDSVLLLLWVVAIKDLIPDDVDVVRGPNLDARVRTSRGSRWVVKK